MLANLPVLANAIPAVQEVMQDTYIQFLRKDFEQPAHNFYEVLSNRSKRERLVARQHNRAIALAKSMDGHGFLKLFQDAISFKGERRKSGNR